MNDITELYQKSKNLPYRIYIEKFSLFRMAGSLVGKRVLDLACGDGVYTREAANRKASYVLGVDMNESVIEQAKEHTGVGLPVEYKVADVASLEAMGGFDLVLGSYLLSHAKTREELVQFAKVIKANLKPGGKFIGINDNPGNAPEFYKKYKKYGFLKEVDKPRIEGSPITYTFFNPDGTTFQLENYYLTLETYEQAFLEAGFESFHFKTLQISEKCKEDFNLEFWRTFLNHPPIIGIVAY